MVKIIGRGSEGIIYLYERDLLNIGTSPYIVKVRPEKKYRHRLIDASLRKYRTRREAKILQKAHSLGINVPKVYKVNEKEYWIAMQYISGKPLEVRNFSNYLDEAARIVAKLHANNIIHGDLHPKNFIFSDNKLYIIDFGLAFISTRVEDKAVDLYELKKLLKEKWKIFEENYLRESDNLGYNAKETINRLEEIEKRGRYKLQI